MPVLQYKTILEGGLPHRQYLSIPPVYLGMLPLPLKGVVDASNRASIKGIDKGGIELRSVKQSFSKGSTKNTRLDVAGIRKRKGNNTSKQARTSGRTKSKKQKRINGRFAK